MTPTNFCYWIQGLLELTPDLKTLNEAQVKMIRDHLGYVFQHMNPEAPVVPVQVQTTGVSPLDASKMDWDKLGGVAGAASIRGYVGRYRGDLPTAVVC